MKGNKTSNNRQLLIKVLGSMGLYGNIIYSYDFCFDISFKE